MSDEANYMPDSNNPSYQKYRDAGLPVYTSDTPDKIEDFNKYNNMKKTFSREPVKSINSDILNASPIVDRFDKGYYTRFKRLPILDPFNPYDGATEYLFFTKPDLCICNSQSSFLNSSMSSQPIFIFANSSYREVLASLQSSAKFPEASKTYPRFIPLLTNSVSSTLDLPDSESSDIESPQNIYGTKIYYRGSSSGSDKDYEFNLEFEDSKQSEVYMFFKLWDEYKKLDWAGLVDLDDHWEDYIAYKVLFDQISIFKIVVASDGYTILFWARIVGCYPKGVPRSVWNDSKDLNNYMKITTSWRGHFVGDMDPIILSHFNKLSVGTTSTKNVGYDIPIYNINTMEMDRRWAMRPYIYQITNPQTEFGVKHPYQLRWLDY